jgi:hypothetical protein
MMKLPLDRSKIGEDVSMIKLQVVQNGGARAVVHEFGALVEEGGVVLVRLDDEERGAGMAGGHWEIHRHAADEEAGGAPGPFQDPGEHGSGGCLAMRAGDGEHVLSGEDVFGQPLRPGHVALAMIKDRFQQRVAAHHNVADHPHVGAHDQLLLVEPFGQLDAERAQLLAHRRIDVRVAAGDSIAGGARDGRDAAHEGAADSEDMEVCAHWPSTQIRPGFYATPWAIFRTGAVSR